MFKKYNLNMISQTRNILFGISILLIMFFHTPLVIPEQLKLLQYIKCNGYIGVEIFLFLSPIGLYYSLEKNKNVLSFYKRRFLRVAFPTLLVSIIWFAMIDSGGLRNYVSNILLISFWTKGNLNEWFIALILVLYIMYPLIYLLLKKWYIPSMLCLYCFAIIFNLILIYFFPSLHQRIGGATDRLLVFLIGCFFAQKIYESKKAPRGTVFLCMILSISLMVANYLSWIYNFSWPFYGYAYIIVPFSISFIIFLSYLISICYKYWIANFLFRVFSFLGTITLEIYLLHEKIIYWETSKGILITDRHYIIFTIVSALVAIISGYLLQVICQKLIQKFSSIRLAIKKD